MSTPKKHHYLPEFYLNGFTNEFGKFMIYKLEKANFVKNGKEFYPSSYFFERDLNTIKYKRKSFYFLEKQFFSSLDEQAYKVIDKLRSSDSSQNFNVEELDLPFLNFFVLFMFWRSPQRVNQIDLIIKQNTFRDLGFMIDDSKLPMDKVELKNKEEEFKNSDVFNKSFKLIGPYQNLIKGLERNSKFNYHLIRIPKEFPSLISDEPIIRENNDSEIGFVEYVFPISGDLLFIKSKKYPEINPIRLKLWVDAILYKQAISYVTCTNSDYIQHLDNLILEYGNVDNIKIKLFEALK
ncbi:conserved hypothetical protein [Tenacibaculum litoreum]|uniref:DUF4238 domain-containing protein n=1 Tax=Tenacibaculum litoreum TaxID=321269 RepID=UPI0038958E6E